MTHAMYDAQRQKIEALFRAHAQQEVAERQLYAQQRAFAYANWLPSNRAAVQFAGRPPRISTTAPYTMHTREEIAILQHEHAVRATEQQQQSHRTQAAVPVATTPRAVPKFNLPKY